MSSRKQIPDPVHLERFDESDFDRLIEWNPNESLLKQWSPTFHFPLTRTELQKHLATGQSGNPPEMMFRAIHSDTGEIVGHGELGSIDVINHSARLKRILVHPEMRGGRGIGTQIVQLLLGIGFDDLQLHRIDLHVLETNTHARRLYRRLGFVHEGLFRECYYRDGRYIGTCRMSILETEWESGKNPRNSS